jgi:hypothetical protein
MSYRKPPGTGRYVVFGILGAGMIWAIAQHSLVAALALIDPSVARVLKPHDTVTLLALADRSVDEARQSQTIGDHRQTEVERSRGAQESASPAEASSHRDNPSTGGEPAERDYAEEQRRLAIEVLAQEPGNAHALAILGQVAHRAGQADAAAAFMRSGARRSLREPVAHAWLINEAVQQQDWPAAMRHADILMRVHDGAIGPLTPFVAQLVETSETFPVIQDAVSSSPSWRRPVLGALLRSTSDARTPLKLMLALKGTAAPPTAAELHGYLSLLIERRYFDLAYHTWLQFLPPEALAATTPIFNGSFESRPSGLPFDWVLPARGTATVEFARRADRPSERALFISFGHGRVELGETTQMLRLRPGRHRINAHVMSEMEGRRGMKWRVTCVGDPQRRVIGESEMFVGHMKEWLPFSFAVTVPAAGCSAQVLRLGLDARTASERLVSGTIWFDELSVAREPSEGVSDSGARPLAKVEKLEGAVLANMGAGYQPISEGGELKVDSSVIADRDARAVVTYADGCTVSVQSGMIAWVDKPSPCALGTGVAGTQDPDPRLETPKIFDTSWLVDGVRQLRSRTPPAGP